MLELDRRDYSRSFISVTWLLMAFQAGYVNVGGFFVSGNFVSHVTGTSSNIGMGIANADLFFLLTFVVVLLAFIGGATFAGRQIGLRNEQKKEPRYVFVLAIKSFFFALVLILSEMDLISWIEISAKTVELLIIFFLSFCCGIQNATCSLSTQGFLKPTHMTGLSTDVGIGLAKMFERENGRLKYPGDAKKTSLRLMILSSFIFGGVVSTMIFSYNGHYGFFFPFISSFSFLVAAVARDSKKRKLDRPMLNFAKSTIVVTFLSTLFFGAHAFFKL